MLTKFNGNLFVYDSGKWGDEEIEMLRSAVHTFGEDLKKISEIIKTKSMYVLGQVIHSLLDDIKFNTNQLVLSQTLSLLERDQII